MSEYDYFEAWWKKQDLGETTHYENNRAWKMVAWNGWLARSLLTAPMERHSGDSSRG